jgi:hypothetical protein
MERVRLGRAGGDAGLVGLFAERPEGDETRGFFDDGAVAGGRSEDAVRAGQQGKEKTRTEGETEASRGMATRHVRKVRSEPARTKRIQRHRGFLGTDACDR